MESYSRDRRVLAKVIRIPELLIPDKVSPYAIDIRLKIYRNLLIDDDDPDPIDIWNEDYSVHVNILRCSREIHDEAAAVLYGENRSLARPWVL